MFALLFPIVLLTCVTLYEIAGFLQGNHTVYQIGAVILSAISLIVVTLTGYRTYRIKVRRSRVQKSIQQIRSLLQHRELSYDDAEQIQRILQRLKQALRKQESLPIVHLYSYILNEMEDDKLILSSNVLTLLLQLESALLVNLSLQ